VIQDPLKKIGAPSIPPETDTIVNSTKSLIAASLLSLIAATSFAQAPAPVAAPVAATATAPTQTPAASKPAAKKHHTKKHVAAKPAVAAASAAK